MNQPVIFSVIIPCHNHGRYLPETIQSVLRSSFKQLEIIIVDDGSEDETASIGKDLASKYPQINYQYLENSGPAAARNKGIALAKGKYILPLDADDLIADHYLQGAFEVLENRPEVKVVYCEAEKFGEISGPWKLKSFSLKKLAKDNMIFVSGIYRRSDWEKCGGYTEELSWGWEDWEFWIKMLKHGGEVVKLPKVGFYYRIHHHSRRKSQTKENKRKLIQYLNEKHPDFFRQQLGGPLRFQRSLSEVINIFYKK